MNSNKINLIYIAGTGRNGSTLLETILGVHPDIVNVGEIQIWPKNFNFKNAINCNCGKSVSDCRFWQKMMEKKDPVKQDAPRIDFFRENYNGGKTLRIERMLDFFSNRANLRIMTYGSNNREIFENYKSISEKNMKKRAVWIVDSSKDPYRLLWLAKSGLFRIKVIHLIKNPKSYVYSIMRDSFTHSKENSLGIFVKVVKKSFSWVIQNNLIELIKKRRIEGVEFKKIRYETLAEHPFQTVEEICRFIGCKFDNGMVENFRNNKNHTIAGNSMRFSKEKIFLDRRWEQNLPRKYRGIINLISLLYW